MNRIKNIFITAPNLKSGIGQNTSQGIREVGVMKITLNKKTVGVEYRKLNNHHGLITIDDNGDELVTMLTTQKKSQSMINTNQVSDQNHLISAKEIVSQDNSTSAQYGVTIKFDAGTSKKAPSEAGEKFIKKYAEQTTNILNATWKNKILEVKYEQK